MDKDKITVIIPAYNEEKSIAKIIRGIQNLKKGYEILVVDDGSEDNTAQIAQKSGASIIRHPYNVGNGAAVKTGVRNARGDIILLLDADEQHNPKDIPRLLAHIKEYDMVVGARTRKSKVSSFRAFGNSLLKMVANYLAGTRVPDLTSGFRAVRRDVLIHYLHILPNRYSYPTTITLALLKDGHTVKYISLETIGKRGEGKSGIQPFWDGLRFLVIIVRIIMLFDPLKVFLPMSIILLTGGLVSLSFDISHLRIEEGTILLLVSGVLIFSFGFLADQLAHIRREMKSEEK